jgi:hypothetical protein
VRLDTRSSSDCIGATHRRQGWYSFRRRASSRAVKRCWKGSTEETREPGQSVPADVKLNERHGQCSGAPGTNAGGDRRIWRRRTAQSREEESPINNDSLIEEINSAYRQLSAATENLARAARELAEHVRRVRLDNAEAILEAKNERTASLYLDGLLDTDEHRRLENIRARAELDHQHARREVDRLHLIVRLVGTQASEGIGR